MLITITNENFESEALQSDKPVLLYFWAPWCPFCVRFSPIVDDFANELPDVKIAKINTDELPDIEDKYEIMTIPSLLLLRKGEVIYRMSEIKSKSEVLQEVNNALRQV